VGALVWKIFKNKLRDRLRQKKRKENLSIDDHDSLETVWLRHSEVSWTQKNVENPILTELENLLDDLNDWERQLLICRANNIPYKVVEEMTGKKADSLKVYYQRLKKKISEKLKKSIDMKREEK
jgi:DNA-directed RNA polymerase specialized sigma24 family protein